jgi:hypothetical protein
MVNKHLPELVRRLGKSPAVKAVSAVTQLPHET